MTCLPTSLGVRSALALLLASLLGLTLVQGQQPTARSKQAWTADEALAQLAVYPRDPYLQYVALQLARRENHQDAVGDQVAQFVGSDDPMQNRRAEAAARREQVDLFSLFSGALAVQESLQLDTMRGPTANARPEPAREKRRQETVEVAKLTGPTIKSHPWEQMLAGRKPDVGPLARMVPEDFYLVELHSLSKALELIDSGDLWARHLFNQATREARTQQVGERIRQQLVVETNRLLRPIYDAVVEEVAITGSDLFLAEGSDVTLVFRARQPELLKARMDGFLTSAVKARPDAKRSEGEHQGIPYVHLTTPERDLHVFSAYPEPGLHVRSNSQAAFFRVLDAIRGQDVRRLGDTPEFAYVRTLMPRGAREEDGLIYLSDPFIRRLVGPQVKLTERRRMLCYNHLRMIGHAALLYRTEHGRPPKSLAELTAAGCFGPFPGGALSCADGGQYTLSADGSHGVCSHHGHAQHLVPCLERPLASVNGLEADEYKAFLDEYNQYWRTFFDPIAIRFQVTPQRYRLETIVLPLLDNSIYTGLAQVLNGKPEPLDALPVPGRNIFTLGARLHKEAALPMLAIEDEAKATAKGPARAKSLIQASNDLKQIALAHMNYESAIGRLPAAFSRDKAGKPLLSWRVYILPYVEQDALYNQFHLNEPWDSEHNKKLIAQMPALYRGPNAKLAAEGKTNYVVPTGAGTLFGDGTQGPRIADISDGISNTIAAVEADDEHAVVWTKPADLTVDLKEPLKGLVRPGQDTFLVAMADGGTKQLSTTIDPKTLSALFTRAGGEAVTLKPSEDRSARASNQLTWLLEQLAEQTGLSAEEAQRKIYRFVKDGLGNQMSLNVYDAVPLFDLDMPQLFGLLLGSFNGAGGITSRLGTEELMIGFLISSLNAPVYLALPLRDTKVVDEFLDTLDRVLPVLARKSEGISRFLRFEQDFYKTKLGADSTMRSYGFRVGPVKWRFFWSRVGNGLYVASKAFILEDLAAAETARLKTVDERQGPPDPDATGHAMLRLRPRNWNRVLADYRLSWAENNRQACLANLGPLSSVGRAVAAEAEAGGKIEDRNRDARRLAERLYAVHFFCPDGGRYTWTPDGKTCSCSVHGTAHDPRQGQVPGEAAGLASVMQDFGGLTATLTFLEDGLHAVFLLERK